MTPSNQAPRRGPAAVLEQSSPPALTVINPFADYQRGDVINDPDGIAAVMAGGNAKHVVQTQQVAGEPTPTPAAE